MKGPMAEVRMNVTKLSVVLVSLLAGCGSDPAPANDFEVKTSFTLAPGEERHECFRVTTPEPIFVSRVETNNAPGIHHQILAIADAKKPDGTELCGLALDASKSWIFHTGNEAGTLTMPEGVALRIPGDSQLLLQLHLYNPTDQEITSDAITNLYGIDEVDVKHRAQLITAGSLNITLPAMQASTVNARCTLDGDVNVFGLLPHMHSMGTTFKTWIDDGTKQSMLYDGEWLGTDDQPFETFAPVPMPKGGSLNVECNYFNSTPDTIRYGDSALDEMCFALTYFYPAVDSQPPLCIK